MPVWIISQNVITLTVFNGVEDRFVILTKIFMASGIVHTIMSLLIC